MYDCLVIGGGPAGVTASIYLKRAGLEIALIEYNNIGGQTLKAGLIENYPGFPSITGASLSGEFATQLISLKVPVLSEKVVSVNGEFNNFSVQTESNTYESKTIIIASGSSPRKLNLPDENDLIGHGVSYCAYCDGNFFSGEDVVIVGGGNSGAEAALYLSSICNKVTLINNNNSLSCDTITLKSIEQNGKITVFNNAIITALNSTKGHFFKTLTGLEVNIKGKNQEITTNGVFVYIGSIPNTGYLAKNYSKLLDKYGYVISQDHTTNVSGLYAAGDVRTSPLKQTVTATSDGAGAAAKVIKLLQKL